MLRLITVECIVTVDNVFVTKHTTICCHYPTFCHLLTWLIQSMPSNIFRLIDFLQLFRWKIHTKLSLKWHSKAYQSFVFILLSQKSLYHLKYLCLSLRVSLYHSTSNKNPPSPTFPVEFVGIFPNVVTVSSF